MPQNVVILLENGRRAALLTPFAWGVVISFGKREGTVHSLLMVKIDL